VLVVCASKLLKQPIEVDIPEEEFERIQKLPSADEQQSAIAKIALQHVKKFGYDLGNCNERKISVNLRACIDCGLRRGMDKIEWEACKRKNIAYKYPTSRTTVNAIKEVKDEKIRSKLELSPEELYEARNLYINDK